MMSNFFLTFYTLLLSFIFAGFAALHFSHFQRSAVVKAVPRAPGEAFFQELSSLIPTSNLLKEPVILTCAGNSPEEVSPLDLAAS